MCSDVRRRRWFITVKSAPPADLLFFNCPECQRTTFEVIAVRYGRCAGCGVVQKSTPANFPPMWTLYDHPQDYPNHFVVRTSWGPWHERRALLADTLELARLAVSMEGGEYRLVRDPLDDPKILESWL